MGCDVNLIEECIGYDALARLADWTGGIELYVPSVASGDQYAAISGRIGEPAAIKLIKWAGGTRLYVPMMFQVELLRRRAEVQALRSSGKTLLEIAREYTYTGRYSQRNIQRLLVMADDEILSLPEDDLQISIAM